MKKILIVSFFMALNLCAYAQNTLNIVVKSIETNEPLNGVTVSIKGTSIAVMSDENGQITLTNILYGNLCLK
jgi:iron complex outermembrane receptor protein